LGKKRHLHCFAHQLNLVAERAIQSNVEIQCLIKKVKNIVTWFKQSNNVSDQLRKAQNKGDPKKLIQEVSTRWNSTYYMIQRLQSLEAIAICNYKFVRLCKDVIRNHTKSEKL
jgi:hypothetical protein